MSVPGPPVRFLKLRTGHRLAFTVHGSGPPLVCPAWWVSHLEDDWTEAGFRELFGGLAKHHTVVRYDRLGSGLSDRDRQVVRLEDEVATLAEVVDHLELERFSMFAVSCAGPPAIAYAAGHPARVDKLVFFGSFVRGADVGPRAVKDAMQGLVRVHWGMGSEAIINLFAPNLAREDVARVSRRHRRAATPEMAAQLLALTFEADAGAAAGSVRAPALVLHRRRDRAIRLDAGRELAASLPDATFVTLEGDAHVPWMGDVAAVLDAVLPFLGEGAVADVGAEAPAPGPAFERRGDVWALSFQGQSVHVKDARGLHDLAELLRRPGVEVPVVALYAGAEAPPPPAGDASLVDAQALADYRRRLEELDASLAEAKAAGDVATAERHEHERDALAAEVSRVTGLGGRPRGFADPSQRARKAVTARVRASIKKIAAVHPGLGAHLTAHVSTGMSCSYTPGAAIDWVVSTDG